MSNLDGGHRKVGIDETTIPGLRLFAIPVIKDTRGWFKENWHEEKFGDLGIHGFRPVQQNVSSNTLKGTTRGLHAEPWDKLISVTRGSVFAAWVDLRSGPSFGNVVQAKVDAGSTVYIPRGVANSFQTLEDETVYSYLVNDHWRHGTDYISINIFDTDLGIEWPIPLAEAIVSDKDRKNPNLSDLESVPAFEPLIIGSSGQVSKSLQKAFPNATVLSSTQFDLKSGNLELALAELGVDSKSVGAIINAAAYTDVEKAETKEGKALAWSTNVLGVQKLVEFCSKHSVPLVHISSDYVFDGLKSSSYAEIDDTNPLNFYGVTKAAGDLVAQATPRHYIVRTSWVVGDGKNFVKTLHRLSREGAKPRVVNDQRGRLTFADDLAKAIHHLLSSNSTPGVYNVTGAGESRSWAEWAKIIFQREGRDPEDVCEVSSNDYASSTNVIRPQNSTLDLRKITESGYFPTNGDEGLEYYLSILDKTIGD